MYVIAGKNDIAVYGLELLIGHVGKDNIIAVVNKTDDGLDGWQRSFLKSAADSGVLLMDLNSVYLRNDLNAFISLEFDRIVDVDKLHTDAVYNIHFSILPKYKGMYTSIWPVLFGDASAGTTLHKIDHGIDTGPIACGNIFDVMESDRSQDLYRKFIVSSRLILRDNISKIIDGDLPVTPQSSFESSYFSKNSINFNDVSINFNNTAWSIKRYVYSLSFRNYQLVRFEGIPISDVCIVDARSVFRPGHIIFRCSEFVRISTIDYDIDLYFDKLDKIIKNIDYICQKDLSVCVKSILGVNDRDCSGVSLIIAAAGRGRIDLIDGLINMGADVNDVDNFGKSVLMYARDFFLESGNPDALLMLLERGVNVSILDHSNRSVYSGLSDQEINALGL